MVLRETLTLSIFFFVVVFKKTVLLRILLTNSCRKKSLALTNCKKNVFFIELEDIESNGVSD